ncbi:MAG: endo-1,4-beta-xylanase [Bacillota bacterium]
MRVLLTALTVATLALLLASTTQEVLAASAPAACIPPYVGGESDVAWRQAAEARIERIRKAELRVVVVDLNGQPVRGATVGVHMKRHAFPFGTAVSASLLTSPAGEEYREAILKHFNVAVFENAFKWPYWENWGRSKGLAALAWLEEHDIPLRGHTLVWPGWQYLPAWVRFLEDDPAALHEAVLEHIREEAGALRGRVIAWDVLNEPYSNRDLMKILGDEAMVEWFKAAREADPGAQLFINDYGILSSGGLDRKHQDAYFATIRYLLEQGAPLDAIGMQGHFDSDLTPPERLLEILDRFAVFDKPIWITEFDVDIEDEELQAAYLRDFFTAVFSHPAVEGILMWGFWDGAHWKQNAPLYRRDWTLKRSGRAWLDLVFGQWWTNEAGTTDANGTFATRGFLGDYEVEVSAGGRRETVAVRLPREGATLRVVLDE